MLSSGNYGGGDGGGDGGGCGPQPKPKPKPKPKKCKKQGAKCSGSTKRGNKCCKELKCISGKCRKAKPPAPPIGGY
ncbi:uncharacterized protein HRG_09407 [Hirsutella rhossiliensis]|uniref:Uncharacterized protein n=1 Tax=Hirsutella rhossiliensis TaxID=111463 RepID=A0A9P8MQY9_9HYPO|nr:uncharacterized protein HRG_09407 [Hirsutella rhossiliensis]KAH0959625.1 hypothetical protein HRG_09407 [Hirsutella rhossiliensis]